MLVPQRIDRRRISAPAAQTPAVPQTGLIGSEQALQAALSGQLDLLNQAVTQGRRDLQTGGQGAQAAIRQGMTALGGGSQLGAEALQGAFDRGSAGLSQAVSRGVSALEPFRRTGMRGQDLMAALLGAQGADAQSTAIQEFQDSPALAWLQEQGQQAVLRNAAATGGTQGGRVLQELTRLGQGLASQQFDTRVNQLGQLGSQGLQAAGAIGSLRGQEGSALASLASQLGQAEAGLYGDEARAKAALAGQGATLSDTLGRNLANLGITGATTGGGYLGQTGLNVAAGRTRAGEQLANLAQAQGGAISDQLGVTSGNLANILAGTGVQQGTLNTDLAKLFASLATGSAGQVAGLPGIPQPQQTSGALGGIGAAAGGIGTLLSVI